MLYQHNNWGEGQIRYVFHKSCESGSAICCMDPTLQEDLYTVWLDRQVVRRSTQCRSSIQWCRCSSVIIKGTVQRDFRPPVFSPFELTSASDHRVKIFSILVYGYRRVIRFFICKPDSPGYQKFRTHPGEISKNSNNPVKS